MTTRASTPPSSPEQPEGDVADGADARKSWGAMVALVAFVATFGVTIFTSIPTLLIGDDTVAAEATGSVVGSLLQNIAFVGVPLLVVGMMIGGVRRRDLGLVLPAKAWRIPLMVLAALILYLLLSALYGHLANTGGQQDDLPEKLGAKGSLGAGIAVGLAVTIFAPIGEEFLLRGVVYPGLRSTVARWAPAWVAILVAGVLDGALFGALHAAGTKAIFLPVLALFGFTLCMLYQASGSLYACILLHATNNTFAMTSALNWSVLGGLALWVTAVTAITLIALAARAVEARLPEPRISAAALARS